MENKFSPAGDAQKALAELAAITGNVDLNGIRIQMPGSLQTYLMMNGEKCLIPNTTTYENLFVDLNGIQVTDLTEIVPTGTSLTSGALLIVAKATVAIYLLSNGVKSLIISEAEFAQYYFDYSKVVTLPPIVVDSIPTGPNLPS